LLEPQAMSVESISPQSLRANCFVDPCPVGARAGADWKAAEFCLDLS
jgi:hypothetical protein